MKKTTLVYTGLATAILVEIAIFLTTTSYLGLGVAIVFYVPLVYFALKLFPRNTSVTDLLTQILSRDGAAEEQIVESKTERAVNSVEILDIDKRAFLKIIGATGLAFFITSIFSRRIDGLLPGKTGSGPTTILDSKGEAIDPAKSQPTDNYTISEVDYGVNSYYGFIDQAEGWFIMKQDLDAGTFRYIKGDKNFNKNWDNREKLKYDYYNRVFPNS